MLLLPVAAECTRWCLLLQLRCSALHSRMLGRPFRSRPWHFGSSTASVSLGVTTRSRVPNSFHFKHLVSFEAFLHHFLLFDHTGNLTSSGIYGNSMVKEKIRVSFQVYKDYLDLCKLTHRLPILATKDFPF